MPAVLLPLLTLVFVWFWNRAQRNPHVDERERLHRLQVRAFISYVQELVCIGTLLLLLTGCYVSVWAVAGVMGVSGIVAQMFANWYYRRD